MEAIKTRLIPESERLDFLPRHAGAHFLLFELAVFSWMERLCAGQYQGGYWEQYEADNGAFFMVWPHDKPLRVSFAANYSDETMSAEAASIAANLFALNELAWTKKDNHLIDAYYALRDFAASHPEGAKIMRVID